MKGDSIFITFPPTAPVGQHSLDAVVQVAWSPQREDEEYCLVAKLPLGISKHDLVNAVGKTCRVDKVVGKVTFQRTFDALKWLCTPDNQMDPFNDIIKNSMHEPTRQQVCLCAEQIINDNDVPSAVASCHRGQLNESQRNASSAALTQRLTLIQGPPGTGKTHCSVAVVRSLVAHKSNMNGGRPILVCAGSNVAVDNLLSALVEVGINALRIGSGIRVDLEAHSVESIAKRRLGPGVSMGNSWKDANALWKKEKELLASCDVVCATNAGAASGMLEKMSFHTILMDEAAQATEPVTLIPIVRRGVRRVILVGDHEQLPPTVVCRHAALDGFRKSLFERRAEMNVLPHVLNIQYRMHPAIATYPSIAFYGGQIRTGINAKDRQLPRGFELMEFRFPIAFCNVPGTEEKHGNSYVNLAEVTKVRRVLRALLYSGDLKPHDIGIICPYAGQVLKIRQHLLHGRVEVSSVDGFQGREKEVIIVSTTRANDEGNLGFVKDLRRMNVTLTRAKRGVVVLGHEATLRCDVEGWGPWLQWIQQQKPSRKRAEMQ